MGGTKREEEGVRAECQAFDLDTGVAVLRWAPKRSVGRGDGQEGLASGEALMWGLNPATLSALAQPGIPFPALVWGQAPEGTGYS